MGDKITSGSTSYMLFFQKVTSTYRSYPTQWTKAKTGDHDDIDGFEVRDSFIAFVQTYLFGSGP